MNKLSDALRMLGDPRWAELPAEALALLEPLPASPALVEALTEVAATESLQGLNDQAIASAERALTLADQLEVSRPARAWGIAAIPAAASVTLAHSTTCATL